MFSVVELSSPAFCKFAAPVPPKQGYPELPDLSDNPLPSYSSSSGSSSGSGSGSSSSSSSSKNNNNPMLTPTVHVKDLRYYTKLSNAGPQTTHTVGAVGWLSLSVVNDIHFENPYSLKPENNKSKRKILNV
jgi:hypothetical protein